MRCVAILALASLVSLQHVAEVTAALVEHNLVVDPDFIHESELNSVSFTRSHLTVPLPELTLSPGDTLRVTVELSGGRYLRLGPTPENGFQDFGASLAIWQGTSGGSTAHGNGTSETVQFYDANSQLFWAETKASSFAAYNSEQQIFFAGPHAWRTIDYGDPTDATFRKWVFEWEMPTTVTTISSTFPNPTTTFTQNSVHIGYNVYLFDYALLPDVAVYVVPEPTSLMLIGMALAACWCRSIRRARQLR